MVAAVAVLIVGISKGGFVGGFGMIAVPLMSIFIDPRQAAAIMLPILCAMDIQALKIYWRGWDMDTLKSVIPGAIIGIGVGTLTFSMLNADMIRILIGVLTLLFILQKILDSILKKSKEKLDYNTTKGVICGALSGFASFIAHAGGGPLSIYVFPLKLDKTKLMATSVLFFIVVNYVKLIPYAWLGQLAFDNLLVSLILLPMAPIGVWLGAWMHSRVSNDHFYAVCYVAMFITAIKVTYDGWIGLA